MAPPAAVPLPEGNPTPSGPTLMSQPAICAGVASLPRFGVSSARAAGPPTPAQPAKTRAATAVARSRVDMLHLAVRRHAPGLNGVEVEDRVVTVLRDEGRPLGLHRPGVVGR